MTVQVPYSHAPSAPAALRKYVGVRRVVQPVAAHPVALPHKKLIAFVDAGEAITFVDTGEAKFVDLQGETIAFVDTGEAIAFMDTGEAIAFMDTGWHCFLQCQPVSIKNESAKRRRR